MKQHYLLAAGDPTGKHCNSDNDLCALDPISEQGSLDSLQLFTE